MSSHTTPPIWAKGKTMELRSPGPGSSMDSMPWTDPNSVASVCRVPLGDAVVPEVKYTQRTGKSVAEEGEANGGASTEGSPAGRMRSCASSTKTSSPSTSSAMARAMAG